MASQTFLIGTGVNSIYACRLTPSGYIELLNETKCGKGSTWLLTRDDRLYAVNEHDDKIETFTIDDRSQGTLTLKNTISSIGDTPCALEIDPSGKWLVVSNYGDKGISNFVAFPFDQFKQPEEMAAQVTVVEGSGPHPSRQKHSYCHHVLFHRGFLYAVDLGADLLSIYQFDDSNGKVSLASDRITTAAGAGPRHILFHPTRPLAFVCNELNSTANVYRVNPSSGQLDQLQSIKTRREEDENDATKENYPAELQLTPDEQYLLVSNRGDENLVVFSLSENDDKNVLSVREHVDCRGSFARFFTFDPTGTFLLVANQNSNNLICFSYNRENGTFTFVSELDNIQSPQHMVFLNQAAH